MEIFSASYVLSMSGPPLAGGALAVENGVIVSVDTPERLRKEHGAPVRDFPGCVIMPGMVNAHTHLELTHFPAWKIRKGLDYAPRTYVDWVIQLIKIKRGLTLPELELSLREGFRISLESGTTTIGDILSDWRLLPHYAGSPLSGRVFFELLGYDPPLCEEQLNRLTQIVDSFAPGPFLPGCSPHAPHTVAPEYFRSIGTWARTRSLPLMVHVAESREESEFLYNTSGRIAEELFPFVHLEKYLPPARKTASVPWLDELGILGSDTAAVHCVHVTGADVEILKKRGASVILCPRSNDRLVVGKVPVKLLKKANVPLVLATDSLASNDSLSLWDEMRFLRQEFPGLFTPREVVEMVTIAGARVLQVDQRAGSLEQGKRGDFLVVQLPGQVSNGDVYEAVVEEGLLKEVYVGGVPFCGGSDRHP